MEPTRLFDVPYHQLKQFPQQVCFAGKKNGKWQSFSTQEFITEAEKVAKALIAAGIKAGDRVAINSNNRPEWNMVDVGIGLCGAISVPVYSTISSADYEFIFNDCSVVSCFVSDAELLAKVKAIVPSTPSLKLIVSFEKVEGCEHFTDFLNRGSGVTNAEIDARKSAVKNEDLATLIYTSGTTGNPKGVMLSHKNIVSNVVGCLDRLPVGKDNIAVSFLPLCHIYERMVVYLFLYTGVSIYYAESMDTIGENIREVKPHVFTAVPRLLEKVFDKIMAKGAELKGIKRALFFWAVALAEQWEPYGAKGWWYEVQLALANKLIFSKWREALGGRVMAIASGSAALQPRLARIFNAAQIPVLEGYGLTETSPVAAVNCFDKKGFAIGTVGRRLSNVEIKIADDGEILIKGPNVMMGYYNRPDLTAEVMTPDGWFKTGDIGQFEQGQYLRITDRKKEIFKTSGGKYIAPQPMENKFKSSRFIEQIMVIGENKKHPAALIVPDQHFVAEWCRRHQIACASLAEMAKNPEVMKRVGEEVERINKEYGQFEQIKKFALCSELWSVTSGELTAKLSLKRKFILQKYDHLVKGIYGE